MNLCGMFAEIIEKALPNVDVQFVCEVAQRIVHTFIGNECLVNFLLPISLIDDAVANSNDGMALVCGKFVPVLSINQSVETNAQCYDIESFFGGSSNFFCMTQEVIEQLFQINGSGVKVLFNNARSKVV